MLGRWHAPVSEPVLFDLVFKPVSLKLETNSPDAAQTPEVTVKVECSRLPFVEYILLVSRGS